MERRPPRATRTATLFPHPTVFRSLSADSLTLEALPADETDTGTPVDDAAASESGEIDEITFDGFDIDDDGASLVVDVPDDAGATASTGGIELVDVRSEEHTSELQSLMRISYAVFCLKKKTTN